MPNNEAMPLEPKSHILISFCLQCQKLMEIKEHVFFDSDAVVIYCPKCEICGIVGDIEFFDRRRIGDRELYEVLRERAERI